MLTILFGSESAEKVLIFVLIRDKGYASEIAAFFDANLFAIQKQLVKFEMGGVLVSRLAGRTRVYQFNPRYTFLPELSALLQKAFTFYPNEMKEELKFNRRRPRRANKPL